VLKHLSLPILAVGVLLAGHRPVSSQSGDSVPPSIVTPDVVETRLGTLDFRDGMPSQQTLDKVHDHLDFSHAVRAFADTLQGVSIHAIRKGLHDVGVKDNEVIVYSELMDARSLFLTANADTVYIIGSFDLTQGPLVLEVPPQVLGTVQDAWFRWVIDVGLPGPDRGEGGKYLIVPPGYDGTLPEGGFNIAHCRTHHGVWFARAFLDDGDDPKPVAERVRKFTRVYAYTPGGVGTPIAEFLAGEARLARITEPAPTVFHEGSGKVMNTIPPNDWSYYEMLNEVVQQEPATALDPELMGPIAAIGIVKGKPFAPDARMKKILTEALAVANATSRSLFMSPRDRSWYYYADSSWQNMLFATGYEFETPIPRITKEGVKPFPPTARRRCTSDRPDRTACRAATGSRPSPARASFRRCACTVRSSRSSTSSGDRARSNSSTESRPPARGADGRSRLAVRVRPPGPGLAGRSGARFSLTLVSRRPATRGIPFPSACFVETPP